MTRVELFWNRSGTEMEQKTALVIAKTLFVPMFHFYFRFIKKKKREKK